MRPQGRRPSAAPRTLALGLAVAILSAAPPARATAAPARAGFALAPRPLLAPGRLPRLTLGPHADDGHAESLAVPLRHTHVEAEVSGFVARVRVTQQYVVEPQVAGGPAPIEAVYTFPLPENAAVHGLRVVVGERVIEAEVQRRAEARETYETARGEGYVAALLEQERPNLFTHSLANLPPGEPIDVEVIYVQPLAYEDGWYELALPTVVGPRFVPGAAPRGGPPAVRGDEPAAEPAADGIDQPAAEPAADGIDQPAADWIDQPAAEPLDQPVDGPVPDADRIAPPVAWAPGHDLSIDVVIAPDLPVLDLDLPTHAVAVAAVDGATVLTLADGAVLPDRDFVARFRVDRGAPHGAVLTHRTAAGDGYLSLVLLPPRPPDGAVVPDWELVFVVDVSGSMTGAPLEAARAAVVEAVGRLRPTDTFNVFTFAGHTTRLFPSPRHATTENVTAALAFVAAAEAGGGTYLGSAVAEALSPAPTRGRQRAVVFLTDGYVGNEAEIIARATALVAAHEAAGARTRVFGVGIGAAPNRYLIEGLAAAGGGLSSWLRRGAETAPIVRALLRRLDEPVLADVEVDWGGLPVRAVAPEHVPDLYPGRPLVLHARWDRPGRGTVTLRGTMGGARVALPVEVTLAPEAPHNEVLPALWARARVDGLLQALREGRLTEARAVRRATVVALAHGIVSPWTSLVAVDRTRRFGNGAPLTVPVPAAPVAGMAPEQTGAWVRGSGGGRLHIHDRAQRVVVCAAAVEIRGGLDRGLVARQVRAHQPALRWCYTEALTRDRTLRGTLVLEFVVAAGRVVSATLARDDPGDAAFATCVLDEVRTWRFPSPDHEGPVRVRYPLRFEPKDGAGPLHRALDGGERPDRP